MTRPPGTSRLAIAAVVVLASLGVGIGVTNGTSVSESVGVMSAPDASDATRAVDATAETVRSVHARLPTLYHGIADATHVIPELLLIFELGLLVEHLRLLNRVGERLPDRIDGSPPADDRPSTSHDRPLADDDRPPTEDDRLPTHDERPPEEPDE